MSDSTELYIITHAAEEWPPLPTWRKAFLAAICLTGNVSEAARLAGISRDTAYKAQARDRDFAAEWKAADEVASDELLKEAWKRAMVGGRQYKFTKTGEAILHPETGEPYYEVVKSDGLLLALLKARLPSLFGDKLHLTAPAPVTAYDLDKLTLEEKQQLLLLSRKAKREADAAE